MKLSVDNFTGTLTTQIDRTLTELETMQNMKRKNLDKTLSFKQNSIALVQE